MAYINNIGFYLPPIKRTNRDLNNSHPEWSVDKISKKTGIYQRAVSSINEFSSDMGVKAAEDLFSKGVDRETVDYLIFCTQSPDYLIPTTACIVQDKLKLRNDIGAIDINMGCSGYLYGISYAKGIINSGQSKNVLLITSEMYTKLIHPNDKSNKTIFGDGSTATLISSDNLNELSGNIGEFSFFTDGSGFDKLILRNSGAKYSKIETKDLLNIDGEFVKNNSNLYMDGKSIFEFTASKVPEILNKNIKLNDLDISQIDLFIFHQANAFMMNFMRRKCGISEEKFHIYLSETGNTVSSTIPLALNNAIMEQKIKKGSTILLIGFGVGLSISSTIIKY